MSCFARAGMKEPKRRARCECGDMVDFHVDKRRVEHFMVCPVVEERVNAGIADVEVDADAVAVGQALFGG